MHGGPHTRSAAALHGKEPFGSFSAAPAISPEVIEMHGMEYLSLEDLLDQDPSAYEFFQTLSPEAKALLEEDDSVTSFARLQSKTAQMRRAGLME